MLEKKQISSLSVESLVEQISAKKEAYEGREPILTVQEEKILKDAGYYPSPKYVTSLQAMLLKFEPSYAEKPQKVVNRSTMSAPVNSSYPGELTFNDFKQSGSLIKISNHKGSNDVYLYFNQNFVKDFLNLPLLTQDKFNTTVSNIRFAAGENEQGLKHLKSHKGSARCHALIHSKRFSAPFSHEIKINGTADRIGVYTLSPNEKGTGPYILVATHVLKGGFHTHEHDDKLLKSNDLYDYLAAPKKINVSSVFSGEKTSETPISKKLPEKTAEQLSSFGVFKVGPEVAVKTNDFMPDVSAKILVQG